MPDNTDQHPGEDAVERHEAGLIAQAIRFTRDYPGARMVALVAEADAPEAASLHTGKEDVLRGPDGSIAVIVHRESAKKLLAKAMPQMLDWLEDEGSGPRRKLPVIHMARGGMRPVSIEYDVAD